MKKNESMEGMTFYRGLEVRMENINTESRTIELSFSSESPVDRFFGMETLGHEKGEVRLDWLNSGNAPLLLDHDWTRQIGVVESVEIGADKKGRAVVRFSKSDLAEEVLRDVEDGIRGNVSVGYAIHKMILENSSDKENESYRITDWEPYELSLVAIPADRDVGVGRNGVFTQSPQPQPNPQPIKEITMNPNQDTPEISEDKRTPDIKVIENDVRKKELERIKSIRAVAKSHNMAEFGERAIEEGTDIGEFQNNLLEALAKREPEKIRTVKEDDSLLGLSKKEAESFSMLRAIRAIANNAPELAPFEMEVSQATRQKFKERAFEGKLQIPMDVMLAKRGLEKGTATQGAELIGTDHLAGSFIDMLRGKMLITQLGARFMSGLVGDISIPKLIAGATAYWVSENMSPAGSEQTTGSVTLNPKTVGAWTDISRKMLLQSSPDAEALVRDDLAKVVAIAIDSAAYAGTGAGAEPTGIINTTGIGAVTFDPSAPTFKNMVDLETAIANNNADLGSLHYVTTPALRGTMKQTLKSANVPGYLWSEGNQVNGYSAHATTLAPQNEVIFGNFSDLIVGNWGVLDLKVDDITHSTSGGLRIIALQDIDVAVRHPESFARAASA